MLYFCLKNIIIFNYMVWETCEHLRVKDEINSFYIFGIYSLNSCQTNQTAEDPQRGHHGRQAES